MKSVTKKSVTNDVEILMSGKSALQKVVRLLGMGVRYNMDDDKRTKF